MKTVYVVAIVAAAVGILALVFILRKRLTRLLVNSRWGSLQLEAEPDESPVKPPALPGKGVLLDRTTVDRSTVEVDNSTVAAHDARVKRSHIKTTESPPSGDPTDG
jgi:hypothetical protein